MKRAAASLLLGLSLLHGVFGQAAVSDILKETKEAVTSERFDLALKLLKAGRSRFPDAAPLAAALGDLYFEKELYTLALAEYRDAEAREPDNPKLLDKLALTNGRLGREHRAAEYYERLHELYPDDRDAVCDLAWMYFKTHQLERGERLLLDAVGRFGMNRRFAMTLGTIYADLYDYERAKKNYLIAIAAASREKETRFASVASYNLSLLEKSFYRYDAALEATEKALLFEDRAPGHLAKGELYEGASDFAKAEAEYRRAEVLDSTPLARINLAVLYRRFGLLDEALAYAKEVLAKEDYSWMFYFGTSKDRFLMDLHRLLADVYKGLACIEDLRPAAGVVRKFESFLLSVKYRALAFFHGLRYAQFADIVGRGYLEKKNYLNAWFTLSLANREFPGTALRYLQEARKLETAITPEAERFYLLEEGKIRKDPRPVLLALERFIRPWERENIEEGLRFLASYHRDNGEEAKAAEAAAKLFEINPGALRQNGLRLPARIEIEGIGDEEAARRLRAFLEKAGFESRADGTAAYTLRVSVGPEGSAGWTLEREGRPGGYAFSRSPTSLRLPSFDAESLAAAAERVAASVFSVRRSQ